MLKVKQDTVPCRTPFQVSWPKCISKPTVHGFEIALVTASGTRYYGFSELLGKLF